MQSGGTSTRINQRADAISRPGPDIDEFVPSRRLIYGVFFGLILGNLLATSTLTVVAPAMPRIVADLGGIQYYSWVALITSLVSTIVSPIFGKLSDLYGRKGFYIAGLVIFNLGSIVGSFAPNIWVLLVARAIQGIGAGSTIALSQVILGDLVPARERGKYQGPMGAVSGVSAIIGPALGGFVTDQFGWRYLFSLYVPVGIVAVATIVIFMHIPQPRRRRAIDYKGIGLMSTGLLSLLVAISLGGTQFPWLSPEIVGLLAAACCLLTGLVFAERRAAEPVLPISLFRSSIVVCSTIASSVLAAAQMGVTFYIPMYVQGVVGASVTASGTALVPMSAAVMITGIVSGQLIARTGRYKPMIVGGMALITIGYILLSRMTPSTPSETIWLNLVVIGIGMGAAQQTFVLIVQNAVHERDLGVATASTQLFRTLGSTSSIAILGTIMTQQLAVEVPKRVPADFLAGSSPVKLNAASVLDPASLAQLPAPVVEAVRQSLGASLDFVFLAVVPAVLIGLVAAVLTKEIPLRRTLHSTPAPSPQIASETSK